MLLFKSVFSNTFILFTIQCWSAVTKMYSLFTLIHMKILNKGEKTIQLTGWKKTHFTEVILFLIHRKKRASFSFSIQLNTMTEMSEIAGKKQLNPFNWKYISKWIYIFERIHFNYLIIYLYISLYKRVHVYNKRMNSSVLLLLYYIDIWLSDWIDSSFSV